MGKSQTFCGGRAEDRHGELVTVYQVDLPLPKDSRESGDAACIEGMPQPEDFWVESSGAELITEPSFPSFRSDRAYLMTARAELLGEMDQHRLGTSRPIRLQHQGDGH